MLEKKTATFPLKFGVDQSADDAADQGGLRELVNGIYDQEGAVQRRGGFQVEATISGTPRGLIATKNALGAVTSDSFVPYIPGLGAATAQTHVSAAVSANTYWYGGRSVRFADAARYEADGNEYFVVVSVEFDTEDGLTLGAEAWLRLFVNGQLVAAQVLSTAHVTGVRVLIATDGTVTTLHQKEDVIAANLWTLSASGFTLVSSVTVSTDVDGDIPMDAVITSDNKVYVLHAQLTDGDAELNQLTADVVTDTLGLTGPFDKLGLCAASSGRLVLALVDSSDDTQVFIVDTATLTQIDNDTGANIPLALNVVPYIQSYTSDTAFTFAILSSDQDDLIGYVRNHTGVFATATVTMSSSFNLELPAATALSKPTHLGGGIPRYFVRSTHPNGFYGAYVMRGDSTVEAQVGYATAVTVDDANYALTSLVADGNVYTVAIPALLSVDENDAFHARGQLVSLDFDPGAQANAELMGVAFSAASLPTTFDGAAKMAQGVVGTPTVDGTTGSAGTLPTGVYTYRAQIQATDTQGHIWYGSMSEDGSVTVTSSPGFQGIDVDIYNLFLPTYAQYDHLTLRVYRTKLDGSIFYLRKTLRIDSIAAGGSLTSGFIDNMSDTDLENNEQLRFPTVELEPEFPPNFSTIWSHRNRLMGINGETPTELWYSKEGADPVAPQWNAVLVKRVENSGGPLLAGASMGDKVVLFQRDQILVMAGEGPSGLGPDASGADGFTTPEIVSLGLGAVDPKSVVQIPGGVLFRADSGWHVIAQDLSVSYIGRAIQAYAATMGTTQAAAYMPHLHQVWIQGSVATDILVFDTRYNRWSTFVLPGPSQAVGFAALKGVAYALTENGKLWVYDPDDERDYDGTNYRNIPVTVGLPWFRPAGMEGDARVWQVVATFADGTDDVTAQSFTASPGRSRAKDPDTADATYTLTLPDNTGPTPTRFRPVKQRCSAFRCRYVIGTSDVLVGAALAGPRLVAVKYVYGVASEDGKSPNTSTAE